MSIKVAYASADERGKASGGKAGDQTGKEVKVANYYQFGQTYVLRWKNDNLGERAAHYIEAIAKSPLVGYDQSQRTTLYTELKAVKWYVGKLKKPVETDCSALIAVVVNAMGIKVSPNLWTGNLRAALMQTGQFTSHTGDGWTNTDKNLKKGDIILNPITHVVMAIEDGANVKRKAPAVAKVGYSGTFPTLPKRGYFEIGDKGEQVTRIQAFCNWAIATKLKTDGLYGKATSDAVAKFQKLVGIKTDGSYGKETLSKAKSFRK